MRTWVGDSGKPRLYYDRNSSRQENYRRKDQDEEHGELHLAALDLLAEVLRRSPHHQARDKHRQHRHHEHSVKARADAAENDFTDLHIDQWNQAAERRVTVVHRVDRAT